MTWPRVILFAAITGIYTGAIMLVPVLESTSFQDIGTYVEWWVIFAVIITVNCEKGLEAALKCFVFFLISQPLVYLTQIVFGSLSFSLAWMYYSKMWLPLTFATLPGGFAAWLSKRQDAFGVVCLGIGNGIELLMAGYYVKQLLVHPPHHLLSILVCIAAVVIMTLCIQKEKKNRIICFAISVMILAALWTRL